MLHLGAVQYKALLLLVVFTANFFVVCHCQASMKVTHVGMHAVTHHAGVHSCCEGHMGVTADGVMLNAGGAGDKAHAGCPTAKVDAAGDHPCDGSGCTHTQAVKFQLLEKQVADQVTQPAVFFTFNTNRFILEPVMAPALTDGDRFRIDQWPGTYWPPDLQVLYQSFLI